MMNPLQGRRSSNRSMDEQELIWASLSRSGDDVEMYYSVPAGYELTAGVVEGV